ncbi:MAG: hypothetical protein LBN96_00715 [Desulfovibrio sp.]|jgi:hypothetical protein|nr:hypothetical protein [Desulfovibrio sp.]
MTDELRKIAFLLSQHENLTLLTLAVTMAVALGCGLVIYLLYRYFYRGVVYSDNFGVLIVIVSGITAFIIVTIGTNLVLSLGMVGALSIVRFRAPVKDPLDVGFLYWSTAAGLTAGAKLYLVAVVGTVSIGLIYIAMTYIRKEKRTFLMILRYDPEADDAVRKLLKPVWHKLKNKNISRRLAELTLEVRVTRNQTQFMEPFTSADFIESATLVEYSGDYA